MTATNELAGLLIRAAGRDDVPALVALFADDALGGHDDTADPSALPDYLAAFDWIAANPTNAIFVAEIDGEVVGTFQTILGRSLSGRGAMHLTVAAVQTRADMRGRGIGTAMRRFAIERAGVLGASKVKLTSNASRTDAHRFYRRLGFAQSHAGFTLSLRSEASD
ncbi:GNAT family N-acetyltransferase [Mesorhizobium sp. J428]|uniref:GNAT family N-acetyltransferase n=1 Tax=Mesorhizobium sp. J428 TaxID=2898440 RepID=UPI002150E4E7|nr:GNAT family N-acetyltransferase [Mesorhizobium sp. J428]MCR5859877.1 GNAT family N-acetyltransferase [Mesorhizobium sp. J428]